MPITNKQLIAYARGQLGRPYWYSCYGQISSIMVYNSIAQRYPEKVKKWPKETYMAQLGQKVHDCSGLIKGAIFCQGDPEGLPKYNCKFDYSADGLINLCTETGPFSEVPNIPGLILWKSGHVGILLEIVNGVPHWIEAKGHNYGVVYAENGTKWQKWGKLPASWVIYEDEPAPTPEPDPKGDKIMLEVTTLKKGSKGPEVFAVQSILKAKGYTDADGKQLETDGSMGRRTVEAVTKYQKATPACGTPDGIVGAKTWQCLINT